MCTLQGASAEQRRRTKEKEIKVKKFSASCLLALMNWFWEAVAMKHLVHSLELNTPHSHPTSFAFFMAVIFAG